jgi:DNA ligase-associated metallophosphoesterase
MRLMLPPGELELLPEHAILEPASRSLMVADLHLGKGLSFRAQGLNVPSGSTRATLESLGRLIERHRPVTLFILGDLLHDAHARHPQVLGRLRAWRHLYPSVEVRLLAGNHDRHSGALPADCGVEMLGAEWQLGAWTLRHEATADTEPARFTIAGHLHPVVRIARGADALSRPCFWLRANSLVVPAFGALTGGWRVQPAAGERMFISDGAKVLEATAAAGGATPRHARRRGPRFR